MEAPHQIVQETERSHGSHVSLASKLFSGLVEAVLSKVRLQQQTLALGWACLQQFLLPEVLNSNYSKVCVRKCNQGVLF